MRKTVLFSVLLFSQLASSCAEKNLNILILGNSITHNSPNESIGWKGDWGMAASAADKDFSSVLSKQLKQKFTPYNVTVTAKNIAVWEVDFQHELSIDSDTLTKKYDVLIIRLGENVSTTASTFQNYEKELNNLINRFKSKNTKVIITGNVWKSQKKDAIQEKIAKDNQYSYISLKNFQTNPDNYATGKFIDRQVAAHPSDQGMENIAELLFKQIENDYAF
jgi:lysophospholipase L1-like esterase